MYLVYISEKWVLREGTQARCRDVTCLTRKGYQQGANCRFHPCSVIAALRHRPCAMDGMKTQAIFTFESHEAANVRWRYLRS